MNLLLRRWKGLSLVQRLWWGGGLILLLGHLLVLAVAPKSCPGILFKAFLWTWAAPTVFYVLFWMWRKITYRIGVRLFFSYLLLGVLPVPLMLILFGFALYLLAGQYASAVHGDNVERIRAELARLADDAARAAEDRGVDGALEVLRPEGSSSALRQLKASLPALPVDWILASGDQILRSDGAADVSVPEWMEEGTEDAPFSVDDTSILAVLVRRGEHLAVVFVRANDEVGKILSDGQWYEVSFLTDREVHADEDGLVISTRKGSDKKKDAQDETADGGDAAATQDDLGFWQGLWERRWIYFIRVGHELRRWSSGSTMSENHFATLIRTSPKEAAGDLFRSPYEIQRILQGVFLAICILFAILYLFVAGSAGISIFAITRSTARLTRGTRHVQAGQLDYRIPVKRRDQLGDLAVAFNRMTESVADMLDEVAEKERLKNELELAREIQRSLLPGDHLEHGAITVNAYFRPAAEVGGDYFDLFPLERGHLIVAVGDVAGHGLSTGLLMAMVKSVVATLIQEGHRGVELLQRLNSFMLQQPREHRMVTLALAEIDLESGVAEITNAAHPPVFLSGGTVREVLLPALPVGYKWRQPPPSKKLELAPGSRLVFYSDGLVEAVDGEGEQLGYEALKQCLERHAELSSKELLERLLAELERHTAGRPLDDDLTILVIDCGAG